MKKFFVPVIAGISILSFVSCDSNSTSETTTDSLNTSSQAAAVEPSTTVDLNASYMDLTTGKTFAIDRDEATRSYVNRETRQPVLYYVNVATNDTFDMSGRWVNGAIIRLSDGNFSVDESRLRIKTDEDGDVKIKDGDEYKLKMDGNDAEAKLKTEGSKEKIDGNKYKKKTDSGKTVIRQ